MGRTCAICETAVGHFGDVVVLGRYSATFDRCGRCGFIAARDPVWLEEAYSAAITKLDLGLLWRAGFVADAIFAIALAEKLAGGTFLDWGGGYGVLTRLMRDRGLDYRHCDPLCENLFASGFEGDPGDQFDLVSVIEVLEHLQDPVAELDRLGKSTDRLLITTELVPSPPPKLDGWWYTAPETGQHISFFTPQSLNMLARRLGYRAYVGRSFVHLFSRVEPSRRTRAVLRRPSRARVIRATMPGRRRMSLLQSDYERVAGELRSSSR